MDVDVEAVASAVQRSGFALVPSALLNENAIVRARVDALARCCAAAAAAVAVPTFVGRTDYVDVPTTLPWVCAVAEHPTVVSLMRRLLTASVGVDSVEQLSVVARIYFKESSLCADKQTIPWHQVYMRARKLRERKAKKILYTAA